MVAEIGNSYSTTVSAPESHKDFVKFCLSGDEDSARQALLRIPSKQRLGTAISLHFYEAEDNMVAITTTAKVTAEDFLRSCLKQDLDHSIVIKSSTVSILQSYELGEDPTPRIEAYGTHSLYQIFPLGGKTRVEIQPPSFLTRLVRGFRRDETPITPLTNPAVSVTSSPKVTTLVLAALDGTPETIEIYDRLGFFDSRKNVTLQAQEGATTLTAFIPVGVFKDVTNGSSNHKVRVLETGENAGIDEFKVHHLPLHTIPHYFKLNPSTPVYSRKGFRNPTLVRGSIQS